MEKHLIPESRLQTWLMLGAGIRTFAISSSQTHILPANRESGTTLSEQPLSLVPIGPV